MKAALVVESLTGNTWKAAELVGSGLQQEGWTITGLSRMRRPDHASIQAADVVLIGTWVHGLFVVGQGPFGVGAMSTLPAMRGKNAVVFCTFALDPAKTLDKMTAVISRVGADVVGGLALHRGKLEQHSEELVARLVDHFAGAVAV